MATPKGMRTRVFKINATEQVHVYSNDQTLILQIRREVSTEEDILATSIKRRFVYRHPRRCRWLLNCWKQLISNSTISKSERSKRLSGHDSTPR